LGSQFLAHEIGDGLHRPAIVHKLSEQRAEQEYREELRDERRCGAHECLRPMGEEGLLRGGGGQQRYGRCKEKHAPAAEGKPDKTPKSGEYSKQTHGQTCSSRTSRSIEERLPIFFRLASRKESAERRPSSRNMHRKSHSALSLEDAPSVARSGLAIRWMRISAHCAPPLFPGSATFRNSAIIRSSFRSAELNETSFNRSRMSRAERGVPGRSTGLTATRSVSCDLHSRTSGVIVGLPV